MRLNPHGVGGEAPDRFTELVALRMLVELRAADEFIQRDGFENLSVARTLGLWDDTKTGAPYDQKRAWSRLRARLRSAERAWQRNPECTTLDRNLARLATVLGLDDVDRTILKFVVKAKLEPLLDAVGDWLDRMSTPRLHRVLAAVLRMPPDLIAHRLAPDALLVRAGLVTVERGACRSLGSKLELINEAFPDLLSCAEADPLGTLRGIITAAPAPTLQLGDYAHLGESVHVLRAYLGNALRTHRKGVNILLYGPPGTGKTQLARVLAYGTQRQLLEVVSEDGDGDPIPGTHRLRALAAAQVLAAKQDSLVVFDEVEDVFRAGWSLFGRRSSATGCKGWINRQLEGAAAPTFWISNSLDEVDAAFLRRFDLVVEIPVPPRRQRERMLRRLCKRVVAPSCITALAESDVVTPAVVANAVHVVRTVAMRQPLAKRAKTLEGLVNGTLRAQGHRPVHLAPTHAVDAPYELDMLNPDSDIRAIADGLHRDPHARICLYGPPGTGKSAFGRWLAKELGVPLQVRRASDLLSPFVGVTEQNLAHAFTRAGDTGALLLIDEIDGFLRSRDGAQRSWEVTQVNEILTQLETFPGLLIGTTNRIGDIDAAGLRRFDAKVGFGYLSSAQVRTLFSQTCVGLQLDPPAPDEQAVLAGITNLTPGDFATVRRQHRFRRIESATDLARLLLHESHMKDSAHRPIGFLH